MMPPNVSHLNESWPRSSDRIWGRSPEQKMSSRMPALEMRAIMHPDAPQGDWPDLGTSPFRRMHPGARGHAGPVIAPVLSPICSGAPLRLLEACPTICPQVRVGSVGSGTSTSLSQPSFSSLMVCIATALALASRSGMA